MQKYIIRFILALVITAAGILQEKEIKSLAEEIITIHTKLDTQEYSCVPIYSGDEQDVPEINTVTPE